MTRNQSGKLVDAGREALEAEPELTPLKPLFRAIGLIVNDLRAPDWLVKGILETNSLAVFYGEPGHGKSFLAIDLASCVATGQPWHSKPVKKGCVFYIAGEGHSGIARRFKAWELHNGADLSDAALAVSNMPLCLDDPETAVRVRDAIEAMAIELNETPALIVVDTLARNFSGDENSSKDMGMFIRITDSLRNRWDSTIIIVHHCGKDATRGARGSSALKAAVDTEYSVAMDEGRIVSLKNEKMKEGELHPVIAFKLKGVELPIYDDEGSAVWSCAPELVEGGYQRTQRTTGGGGKNQSTALTALKELYQEHRTRLDRAGHDPESANVTIEDWRSACVEKGLASKRFGEVMDSLVRLGKVQLQAPFVRII